MLRQKYQNPYHRFCSVQNHGFLSKDIETSGEMSFKSPGMFCGSIPNRIQYSGVFKKQDSIKRRGVKKAQWIWAAVKCLTS